MRTLLALLLATPLLCHARIGETVEQLEKRFGKPVEQKDSAAPTVKVWKFAANGVDVRVLTFNGISVEESYDPLSSEQMDQILKATGHDWGVDGRPGKWKEPKGATAEKLVTMLVITHPDRAKAMEVVKAASKRSDTEKVKGF